MNELIIPLQTYTQEPPRRKRRPIGWLFQPVPEGGFPGIPISNHHGFITLGTRSFGPFEAIKEFVVADCIVVRRPIKLVQRLDYELDGEEYFTEIDHRCLCGWRCFGIEPIVEIRSLITAERWWLVYMLNNSGDWLWFQMTPHTNVIIGADTVNQLCRLRTLVIYVCVVAAMYAGATGAFIWGLKALFY